MRNRPGLQLMLAIAFCAAFVLVSHALQLPGPQNSPLGPGTIATANIADGAVTNAKVSASAAIAGSKLNFATTDATDTAVVMRKNAANTLSFAGANQILLDGTGLVNTKLLSLTDNAGSANAAYLRSDGSISGAVLSSSDDTSGAIVKMGTYGTNNVIITRNTAVWSWSSDGTWYGTADAGLGRKAAGIVEINGGAAGSGGQLQLWETVAPAAPASGCTLYVDSTTHNLCAKFSTGAAVVVGTHP